MGQKVYKMPIISYIWGMGIRFLAIFRPIGLKFFMVTQETIVYYLSIGFEKSWLWALFAIFDFVGPAGY